MTETVKQVDELVERLRARRMSWIGAGTDPDPDCAEAATALSAQQSEIERLRTSGIAEIAAVNQNVMDYMRHWEARAEKAEAAVEELAEACRQAKIQSRRAFNLTENFHAVLGAVATAVDPALAAHTKLKGKV